MPSMTLVDSHGFSRITIALECGYHHGYEYTGVVWDDWECGPPSMDASDSYFLKVKMYQRVCRMNPDALVSFLIAMRKLQLCVSIPSLTK